MAGCNENGPACAIERLAMPAKNEDLHGNAPENSSVALLLIDVINDLEFEGAGSLVEQAEVMAKRIASLKERARDAGIPAIYANDNFGRWQSDFRRVVTHCLEDGVRGEQMARILQPAEDDYFVLKPKLRFLRHHTRHPSRLHRRENVDSHRHCRQHLHPFQRERRLHAGLQHRCTSRLRRIEQRGRESPRPGTDETCSESGYNAFDVTRSGRSPEEECSERSER